MSSSKDSEQIAVLAAFLLWIWLGLIGLAKVLLDLGAGEGINIWALTTLLLAIPSLISIIRGGDRLQRAMMILWKVLVALGIPILLVGVFIENESLTHMGEIAAFSGIFTLSLLTKSSNEGGDFDEGESVEDVS